MSPRGAFRFLAHHLNALQIGPILIQLYQSQIGPPLVWNKSVPQCLESVGNVSRHFFSHLEGGARTTNLWDSDFRLSKELGKSRKNGDCSITEESSRSHRHRRQRRRPYPPTLPFSSGAGSPSWRFRAFRHRSPPRLMLHPIMIHIIYFFFLISDLALLLLKISKYN